jgi:hypothetical protein
MSPDVQRLHCCASSDATANRQSLAVQTQPAVCAGECGPDVLSAALEPGVRKGPTMGKLGRTMRGWGCWMRWAQGVHRSKSVHLVHRHPLPGSTSCPQLLQVHAKAGACPEHNTMRVIRHHETAQVHLGHDGRFDWSRQPTQTCCCQWSSATTQLAWHGDDGASARGRTGRPPGGCAGGRAPSCCCALRAAWCRTGSGSPDTATGTPAQRGQTPLSTGHWHPSVLPSWVLQPCKTTSEAALGCTC